jgi:antitoxin component of RelBE/YafQ-DinJ toxin-antitoxin module
MQNDNNCHDLQVWSEARRASLAMTLFFSVNSVNSLFKLCVKNLCVLCVVKTKGVNMSNDNMSISPDAELVSKAQVILSDLGIDMNTAVNIFLQQLINKEIKLNHIKKAKKSKKRPVAEACGLLKGKIWYSDDFDEPLYEEFKEYM